MPKDDSLQASSDQAYIDDFLARKFRKSRSFATKISYKNSVKKFQEFLENRSPTNLFSDFETKEWNKIKQNSFQSMIEDDELRRRVEKFYGLLQDYNKLSHQLFGEVNKIILENFSNHFKEIVASVEVHLVTPDSGNTVHLPSCALAEIHPMDYEKPSKPFGNYILGIKTNNQLAYKRNANPDGFNKAWALVIDDIQKNKLIGQVNTLLAYLKVENQKLMKIYSDRIAMQLKV